MYEKKQQGKECIQTLVLCWSQQGESVEEIRIKSGAYSSSH